MTHPENALVTPIYLKTEDDMPWPEDKVFYMLTSGGLFLCRNHKFFRSCVPAPRWPTELAPQQSFLAVNYPKLSRRLMERVVGFFDRVARLHGSEAGVLLAWDTRENRIRAIVPDQVATVNRSRWGDTFAIGLEYEAPPNLPAHWTVIGDVHSHVDSSAYASYVDKHDETYRPGLHIVVGRISWEPPDFHVEAVVDGNRFTVDSQRVIGGYRRRDTDVPDAWLAKVDVKVSGYKKKSDGHDGHYGAAKKGAAKKEEEGDSAGGNGRGDSDPVSSQDNPVSSQDNKVDTDDRQPPATAAAESPRQEVTPDDLTLDLQEVLEEEQDERS